MKTFDYAYDPRITSKGRPQWRSEDFSSFYDNPMDDKLLRIFSLLLEKCDQCFVEKSKGDEYELYLASDELTDGYYFHTRYSIIQEINSFAPEKVRIYFTNWDSMPEKKDENNETIIDLNGGEFHYLSEIMSNRELYDRFMDIWGSFLITNRKEKNLDMEVVVMNKAEVEKAINSRRSALIEEIEVFENMVSFVDKTKSKLEEEMEKFKTFSQQLRWMSNSTLILIKPAAVAKGLTNPIVNEFLKLDYKLLKGAAVRITKEQAEEHYAEHKGKPFFEKIVEQLSSGTLHALIIGHDDENCAINVRKIVGATDPKEAEVGTIRAKYGTDIDNNVIHASDSRESAARETRMWINIIIPEKK